MEPAEVVIHFTWWVTAMVVGDAIFIYISVECSVNADDPKDEFWTSH